jgi:hypothetical protein
MNCMLRYRNNLKDLCGLNRQKILPEETGQLCHELNRQAAAGGSRGKHSDTVRGVWKPASGLGLPFLNSTTSSA